MRWMLRTQHEEVQKAADIEYYNFHRQFLVVYPILSILSF